MIGQEPKVVLVTGAAGAIGSATVGRFLNAGFHVIGLDRDRAVVGLQHANYAGFQVDVANENSLVDALGQAQGIGRLVHLIGIAGGALPQETQAVGDPGQLGTDIFRASVEANLTTQFHVFRTVLPWLRRASDIDRSITFTSSFNALSGWGLPAYSAAKAGLIGLMQALAPPLGAEGIRVNVVAPGTVRTPRTERIWANDRRHFERLEKTSALGRLGRPDDVAAAFFALAVVLTHVTGQVLVVDGGQTVMRVLPTR